MRFWRRSDADFRDEVDAHIALEVDRLIASGMSADDAQAAARRAFGNVTVTRETFSMSQRGAAIEQLLRDVRYALRSMRRSRAFTFVAVSCLAIGISVNTAAFSVLNALLLREFPGVVRQRELASVLIGRQDSSGRSSPAYASPADWDVMRSQFPAFSDLAASGNAQVSIRANGEPHSARGEFVSGSYFTMLGTRPAVGRLIVPRDDQSDAAYVAVLSHRFWQLRFGGRTDVVGQTMTIGAHTFTVIGVAPVGFFGLNPGDIIDPDFGAPDVFVPLAAAPFVRAISARAPQSLDDRWLEVVGRIAPGATVAQAEQSASNVASLLARTFPRERSGAFAIIRAGSARTENASEAVAGAAFVMAVPIIILLVACANLANQVLARGVQRAREIAVRMSLGATRGRIVRQLLVETVLLSLTASAVGVLLARLLLDILRTWYLPVPFRIPIDLRVLSFTVGLALISAVVFGLAPALRATRGDFTGALKNGTQGSGLARSRLRGALVIAQLACSLALITAGGAFSAAGMRADADNNDAVRNHLMLASVDLDLVGFDSSAGRAYQALVARRLASLPGVAAVGMSPLAMFEMPREQRVRELGKPPGRREWSDVIEVSGEWFTATNTIALQGRLFTRADQNVRPAVAVVDDAFARGRWDNRDVVGRVLRVGDPDDESTVTVIGVVPTRPEMAFRQPEGVLMLPGGFAYRARTHFFVRTTGDVAPMIAEVRSAMRAIDPRVPIVSVRTMEDVAAHEASPLVMIAAGLATLGSVALALAALGLFGVLAFLVAQRRHEIGVRVALGARQLDVTWMVVRQSLTLTAFGIAAGTLIAMIVVALLRSVIHGMDPVNPVRTGVVAALMLAVALVASVVPARRAAGVDPMTSLRPE